MGDDGYDEGDGGDAEGGEGDDVGAGEHRDVHNDEDYEDKGGDEGDVSCDEVELIGSDVDAWQSGGAGEILGGSVKVSVLGVGARILLSFQSF